MCVVHRVRLSVLLGLALVACGDQGEAPGVPSRTEVASNALTAGPKIALLVSAPGSGDTAWVETSTTNAGLPPPLARLSHLADGEVRAALLPDRHALAAIADMERVRDATFGSWLVLLEPSQAPRKLLDHCVHASRPLVLDDGSIVVERGSPGPEPNEEEIAAGALRTDALSVVRLDATTGQQKTLHTFNGYATHLAGQRGNEIVLYRVSFQHADLVAVNSQTGELRTLAPEVPAFARDFSVDGERLLFTNRLATGWAVVQLDLASGAQSTLHPAEGLWALPHAFPGGGLLINDGRGGTVLGGQGLDRPLGAGFDVLEDASADGRFVALSHRVPGARPQPYVVDLQSNVLLPIAVDGEKRAEVVGLLP